MEKLENFVQNLRQVNPLAIDWGKLLNWDYLTDPNPNKSFIFEQWIYVIVLMNMFLAIIAFKVANRIFADLLPKRVFVKRISFLWLGNTVFLLLYNLFRSQGVALLSMRIFVVIIVAMYIGILLYGFGYWLLYMPKRMEKFHQARVRNKYQRA